ncbi:MAG: outer membrane protein transport protein [Betaproteobacteria bacterium]|nr:MAG: outer membrane protein transport protein [Betaproteobacteria bacterium]
MIRTFGRTVIATAIAGLFSASMNGAYGAGFQLFEQSASGQGNAYAGAAAVAEDASTIFFNPAGLSFLDGAPFAIVGHVINLSAEFSGTATNNATCVPPSCATTGNTGGDIGDTAFVPNVYAAMSIGDKWDIGIGINAPFGLKTEYNANWDGRFQGVKSELASLNVNPTVSYRISDSFSIGGGINWQRFEAELTNAVFLPVALNTFVEGSTKLEADDDGWGWNIGALWQLSQATRLGVAYRSEIDYTLEGNVTTLDPTGALVAAASGAAKGDATLPDMLSLSVAFQASDRFQLLADITRTGWSSINQINVVDPATGTTRDVLVLDFDDAFRYSIGGNYVLGDFWTLKAGLAFDETPVKNAETRTVRLPDNDRTWISIGLQRKVGQSGKRVGTFDIAYSHIFIKDAPINHTKLQPTPLGTPSSTVTGNYEGSVDVFSIQYSVQF